MNLESFYTITTRTEPNENTLYVTIEIDSLHEVFKGHFPGHPVVPGVALLQISKELCETYTETPLVMKEASRVKFVNLVNPLQNNQLNFTLTFEAKEGLLKVKNSTTFVDQTPVMQCMLTFEKI